MSTECRAGRRGRQRRRAAVCAPGREDPEVAERCPEGVWCLVVGLVHVGACEQRRHGGRRPRAPRRSAGPAVTAFALRPHDLRAVCWGLRRIAERVHRQRSFTRRMQPPRLPRRRRDAGTATRRRSGAPPASPASSSPNTASSISKRRQRCAGRIRRNAEKLRLLACAAIGGTAPRCCAASDDVASVERVVRAPGRALDRRPILRIGAPLVDARVATTTSTSTARSRHKAMTSGTTARRASSTCSSAVRGFNDSVGLGVQQGELRRAARRRARRVPPRSTAPSAHRPQRHPRRRDARARHPRQPVRARRAPAGGATAGRPRRRI